MDVGTSSYSCWCERSDIWLVRISDYSEYSGTPLDFSRDWLSGGSDLRRHDPEWNYSEVAFRYVLGRTPLWFVGRWIGGILVLKTHAKAIGKAGLNPFIKETVDLLLEYYMPSCYAV